MPDPEDSLQGLPHRLTLRAGRTTPCLALLCCAVLQTPAWALSTAERLEELTKTFLGSISGASAVAYQLDTTEEADGTIVITLLDISLGDHVPHLVVDDVAVTWRTAGDGLYAASMAIPAITAREGEGDTIARLTAGGGTLALLVDIDTGHVQSGTMDATGVTVSLPGGHAAILVDHLRASLAPHEAAPLSLAGDVQLALSGLTAIGDDGTTITLTRGHVTVGFRNIPATAIEGRLPEGAWLAGEVAFEGLSAADTTGIPADMKSCVLEFTVAGTGAGMSTIAIHYEHEGLTLRDAGLAPVTPHSLTGEVGLDALPVADLLAGSVPQGVTLDLGLEWTWVNGAGSATGLLTSAALAPVPGTGNIKVVTSGLPDLVEDVMALARDGNRRARLLGTYLSLFGAMGRNGAEAEEPRLVHDIALLDDSRILVNGNDINILLSLLGTR